MQTDLFEIHLVPVRRTCVPAHTRHIKFPTIHMHSPPNILQLIPNVKVENREAPLRGTFCSCSLFRDIPRTPASWQKEAATMAILNRSPANGDCENNRATVHGRNARKFRQVGHHRRGARPCARLSSVRSSPGRDGNASWRSVWWGGAVRPYGEWLTQAIVGPQRRYPDISAKIISWGPVLGAGVRQTVAVSTPGCRLCLRLWTLDFGLSTIF